MCESVKLILCKPDVLPLLSGNGVDLGAGIHKVRPEALGVDFGSNGINWIGDVTDLNWFRDNVLDYVFSSHCLEHVTDDRAALREWIRVLKPGGRLVLYLPDDAVFDNTEMVKSGEHQHVYTQESLYSLLSSIPEISVASVQQHAGAVPGCEGQSVYSLLAVCFKR